MKIGLFAMTLATLFLANLSALAQDAANSADHPLVGRYEGSVIKRYLVKGYEETSLVIKPIPSAKDKDNYAEHSMPLAGKLTRITYEGPAERSILEVIRNYQNKLEGDGFDTVFFCRQKDCGHATSFWSVAGQGGGLLSQWHSNTYVLLKKESENQNVWVSAFGVEFGGSGGRPLTPQVLITVVETQALELDKIVVQDAKTISSALNATGRIALYGIFFDFDRADPKPESEAQITEIAGLLNSHPELEILVVGHTDAKGAIEYNANLSQRRAAAVVTQLVQKHQVAAARLTAIGVGMAAPLASNATEEGRAKNRRVEIVAR